MNFGYSEIYIELQKREKDMKRLVIILGMHRSGTSVVTQICQYMGAYLGKENELIIPDGNNPDGYFENIEITSIDDKVLHICGREWYSLEGVEIDSNSSEIKAAKNELKHTIKELFEKSDIVAVKDPRIAILLPLWEEILEEIGIDAEYIWVFRNPLEVSESLRKRNGFCRSHSLLLWINYNLNIIQFLADKDYLMINYNNLLKDLKAVESLSEFFCVRYDSIVDSEVKNIIKQRYVHSIYSPNAVGDLGYGLLSELYTTLLENKVQKANLQFWKSQYVLDINREENQNWDHKVLHNVDYLNRKELIIYGAGNYGVRAAEMLLDLGVHKFQFCDKDNCKQGNYIMGGRVLNIEEIEKKKNVLIIIAIADERVRREVEQTLVCLKGVGLLLFTTLEKIWKYSVK